MLEDFYLVRYKYGGEVRVKRRGALEESRRKAKNDDIVKSHPDHVYAKSPKRAQNSAWIESIIGCLHRLRKVKKTSRRTDGPP
jgi:hypothetical protein